MSDSSVASGVGAKEHMLSNKAYELLKMLVTLILPGFSTLYFALSGIWGFPNAEKVVGTVAAVSAFLGVLMKVASASYNKSGVLNVPDTKYSGQIDIGVTESGVKTYALVLDDEPSVLDGKGAVAFKINNQLTE